VDGLAGGVSFITSMSLLAVAAQFAQRAAATLVLAGIAGAALGFLRHNFPPSRIIMGDTGAYFFGFVLAASSILGGGKITTIFGLFPTVLFLLLPLIDTAQVVLRRLLRRKNPLSTPGKDHLHHRLLARGWSQTRTTLILWGVTLVTNLVAMKVQGLSALKIAIAFVGIVILLAFIVWRRRRAFQRGAALAARLPKTDGANEGPPV
jgi:UDP-GlcNAc:undecaprenyl-phosphate GlcNAc-1-phosphate transferase